MIKVELVDKMGNDVSVVNAARVSYSKESKTFTLKDEKLIKYLAEQCRGRQLFDVIFDYQKTSWDTQLTSDNVDNDSEIMISMQNSHLIDSVATPLTLRVIHNGSEMQLHATSECQAIDQEKLSHLLSCYANMMEKAISNI